MWPRFYKRYIPEQAQCLEYMEISSWTRQASGMSPTPAQYLSIADQICRYNNTQADDWAASIDMVWYSKWQRHRPSVRRYRDTAKFDASSPTNLTYSQARADKLSVFLHPITHLDPASLLFASIRWDNFLIM